MNSGGDFFASPRIRPITALARSASLTMADNAVVTTVKLAGLPLSSRTALNL